MQEKLSVEINLSCLRVSKYIKNYLVSTNIIVSLDPCLLSSSICPSGWGTTPEIHLFSSLDLHFHLLLHPMCYQQSQRSNGHPLHSQQAYYTLSIPCTSLPIFKFSPCDHMPRK